MTTLVRSGSGWHLEHNGTHTLILGGELHNSSATDRQFLRDSLAHAVRGGITAVLAAIAWEGIEREEGQFDLTCVDALAEETAALGLSLIPLWFGAWKNGRSTYAPGWVLDDRTRFPHAEGAVSHVPTLSLFNTELAVFEKRAYLKVVERLVSSPADIIAIQIDNEVGLLGDSRDRSDAADAAYQSALPTALALSLGSSTHNDEMTSAWTGDATSWSAAFGDSLDTDERFMAWYYAAHIEKLAAPGREILDVPVLVNAWLDTLVHTPGFPAGGDVPGEYPSGGPLPQVALAWNTAAPTVEILAPDIYFGDDREIMERFARHDAPLFIPETNNGKLAAARAFLAIGEFGALGLAPFGIDQASDLDLEILDWAFDLLRALTPAILEARTRAAVTGFFLDDRAPSTIWTFNGMRYKVAATASVGSNVERAGYGLLIGYEDGRLLVAGEGFTLKASADPSGQPCHIRDAEEGRLVDGNWKRVRGLNGDETFSGEALIMPQVFRVGERPATGDHRSTGVRRARFVR